MPSDHFIEHRIGSRRDQRRGLSDAVRFLKVRLIIPGAHPACIHGNKLPAKTENSPLVLADHHRVESNLAVPGDSSTIRSLPVSSVLREVPLWWMLTSH